MFREATNENPEVMHCVVHGRCGLLALVWRFEGRIQAAYTPVVGGFSLARWIPTSDRATPAVPPSADAVPYRGVHDLQLGRLHISNRRAGPILLQIACNMTREARLASVTDSPFADCAAPGTLRRQAEGCRRCRKKKPKIPLPVSDEDDHPPQRDDLQVKRRDGRALQHMRRPGL